MPLDRPRITKKGEAVVSFSLKSLSHHANFSQATRALAELKNRDFVFLMLGGVI